MKGKGKGERKEAGREKEREKEKEKERDDTTNLNFPDLKPVEHVRLCPRYSAVLNRKEEDSVGLEEIDMLQSEMETILASVAKRMHLLEGELTTLSSMADKGKDKKPMPGKGQPEAAPSPSGKRSSGKGADDKPNKKFKDPSGKATHPPTPSSSVSKPKGKVQTKVQEYDFAESPKALPPPPPPLPPPPPPVAPPQPEVVRVVSTKNDIPNRFWSMVEPYCNEVTNDDLKVLEDVLRSHEDDVEYYKMPSLGKHFAQKWAQEDLIEEQRQGTKLNNKKTGLNNNNSNNTNNSNNSNSNDSAALLKRLEDGLVRHDCRDDSSSPFGALTQRLVQALIEENIMSPLEDTTISQAEAIEAATISPRSLARQLNLGNVATLERRIKKELEEQGILEMDEKPDDNPDDEILAELRRKQQELKALSQHNLNVTKRLYKLAKEEIQRQELRKKMAVADAEVLEAYRKIQAARQKKKPPTKKERDVAHKALKERESIIKQLESLGS